MKFLQKRLLVLAVCITFGFILSACGNKTDQSENNTDNSKQKQSQSDNQENKGTNKDLKGYSNDPDKSQSSEDDFDLVGILVKETDKLITLDIKGKTVDIHKKSSYKKDTEGYTKALEGKQVVVEVSMDKQEAENMKPTDRTRANKDGVYETEGKEKKVIGKLISIDQDQITIHTDSGNKSYKMSDDFELDDEAKKQEADLDGQYVHLNLNEHNAVDELEYNWVDQE
ncbi:hypothetical protein QR721_01190 [Aciduricibacillus chroicocephali]|uniref:Lipoprotein n=1 Tax=Aciduricibacillus chroicocephali TaxID=3054939 RepID=A0ABY9KVW1_9BACI|nr:hypothetical protein QR721_01190 [Bacillaceae bacterium 44XB]